MIKVYVMLPVLIPASLLQLLPRMGTVPSQESPLLPKLMLQYQFGQSMMYGTTRALTKVHETH